MRIAEHPLVKLVREIIPADIDVFLIGGALRDELLKRPVADFDFTLAHSAFYYARKIANRIGGAFFPLDEERQTGRVLWQDQEGKRYKMDFSLLRGASLEEDLQTRDFTINALAMDVHDPTHIYDPLGGAQDLWQHTLRVCSRNSLTEDPLRILRGIRLAVLLDLHIHPQTWHLMQSAVQGLERVSAERIRDELFHILVQNKSASALQIIERLGALDFTFPELLTIQGVRQSPPHYLDVYQHTLRVVQNIEEVSGVLTQPPETGWQANLISGMTSQQLGRYRAEIAAYLQHEIVPERPLLGLLKLAGLYHDSGKAQAQTEDDAGRIHFYGHEEFSAQAVAQRMRQLAFANTEIEWVSLVVLHHMRPINLALADTPPSAKAIYRFYRAVNEAGIGIGLLSLADVLGAYGTAVTATVWQRQLDIVRILFEAWWEKKPQLIKPARLLNGNDLMEMLGLPPGPQIGKLLEAIQEAQVSGEIADQSQALELARHLLNQG
ncbi:MAG: HD domain-containing protein [Anaerolineales bacterium]